MLANVNLLLLANPEETSITTLAALAFHCVAENKKNKEFHYEVIRANLERQEELLQIVEKIGLPRKDIGKCIDDRKYIDQISADFNWAMKITLFRESQLQMDM